MLIFFIFSFPQTLKNIILNAPYTFYSRLPNPLNLNELKKEYKKFLPSSTNIEHIIPQSCFTKTDFCFQVKNHPYNLYPELVKINNLRGNLSLKATSDRRKFLTKTLLQGQRYFFVPKEIFAIYSRTLLFFLENYSHCLDLSCLKNPKKKAHKEHTRKYPPSEQECHHIAYLYENFARHNLELEEHPYYKTCFP